jgi:hypothetical protein
MLYPTQYIPNRAIRDINWIIPLKNTIINKIL